MCVCVRSVKCVNICCHKYARKQNIKSMSIEHAIIAIMILIIVTYRQRSISMLFPKRVPLLLDFQRDTLSICHHLQWMVQNLIPNDLLYCTFHPAKERTQNEME